MNTVRIEYHRPPGRHETFVQRLVHRSDDVLVTFVDHTPLERPVVVDDRIILDEASPAIWFTFPGAWHDIGRFHLPDGTFTGIYTNILTPVRFLDASRWETTDLFLDVWQPAGRPARLLDEDEFEHAIARGWLDSESAHAARREAARILALAARNDWPPALVHEWTLDRVRASMNDG